MKNIFISNILKEVIGEKYFDNIMQKYYKQRVISRIRHPHKWQPWYVGVGETKEDTEICLRCGLIRESISKKYLKYNYLAKDYYEKDNSIME